MIKCIFETNHFFTSMCNLEIRLYVGVIPLYGSRDSSRQLRSQQRREATDSLCYATTLCRTYNLRQIIKRFNYKLQEGSLKLLATAIAKKTIFLK